jgi:hypothetical protein
MRRQLRAEQLGRVLQGVAENLHPTSLHLLERHPMIAVTNIPPRAAAPPFRAAVRKEEHKVNREGYFSLSCLSFYPIHPVPCLALKLFRWPKLIDAFFSLRLCSFAFRFFYFESRVYVPSQSSGGGFTLYSEMRER